MTPFLAIVGSHKDSPRRRPCVVDRKAARLFKCRSPAIAETLFVVTTYFSAKILRLLKKGTNSADFNSQVQELAYSHDFLENSLRR